MIKFFINTHEDKSYLVVCHDCGTRIVCLSYETKLNAVLKHLRYGHKNVLGVSDKSTVNLEDFRLVSLEDFLKN